MVFLLKQPELTKAPWKGQAPGATSPGKRDPGNRLEPGLQDEAHSWPLGLSASQCCSEMEALSLAPSLTNLFPTGLMMLPCWIISPSSLPEKVNRSSWPLTGVILLSSTLFLSLSGVTKLVSQIPYLLTSFSNVNQRSLPSLPRPQVYLTLCLLSPSALFTLARLASSYLSNVTDPFLTLSLAVSIVYNAQHILCNTLLSKFSTQKSTLN